MFLGRVLPSVGKALEVFEERCGQEDFIPFFFLMFNSIWAARLN